MQLAKATAEVTHNHPEGILGAQITAACIYLARAGCGKDVIRDYVESNYCRMDFTLDGLRRTYRFTERCAETVPQAIFCFLESTDFEDAIRNVISIGGDSDTLGAITGGIAEAFYGGVPAAIRREAMPYLSADLQDVLERFESAFQ